MAVKGLDTGKAFLQGVLGKITDPEQRAAAEKLLANETFVTEVGNGVAGQSEIDRQLQTLRTQGEELTTRAAELDQRETGLTDWHGRLAVWHKDNKAAIEAGARALKGTPNPDPAVKPGAVTPPAGLTEEQYNERIASERAAFLGFSRDQNAITREHYSKFNEIVDLQPLLTHPKIAEVGLLGVYELVHKERLDKHKADAVAAHDKQVADEAVRKHLETQAAMPYLPPTGAGSGSPLDALTPTKEPLVDAATAHYNRLVMERAAAPGGRT